MPSIQTTTALVAFISCIVARANAASIHNHGVNTLKARAAHRSAFAASRRSHLPSVKTRRSKQRLVRRADSVVSSQPDNIADGTATADEGCTQWVQPTPGDSCYSVMALSAEGDLSLADFLDLNTSLDQDCQNLSTQVYYCIDTVDDHNASPVSNAVVSGGSSGSCSSKKSDSKASSSGSSSQTSKSNSGSSADISANLNGASAIRLSAVVDSRCGKNGATASSSDQGGPNGSLKFLNCGLSKSNPSALWTPPVIKMDQLVYEALDKQGVFAQCSAYFDLFEKYGDKYNIPPIFLAAFAMQESSCNPNASGDAGGAFGLMQITADKCGGAPGGNCNDPDYNVMTGAAYFASQLQAFNGDVLRALGQYNGWTTSMSFQSATAAANSGCCVSAFLSYSLYTRSTNAEKKEKDCQNNLDYINSFLNLYILNKPVEKLYYNNLAVCSHQ